VNISNWENKRGRGKTVGLTTNRGLPEEIQGAGSTADSEIGKKILGTLKITERQKSIQGLLTFERKSRGVSNREKDTTGACKSTEKRDTPGAMKKEKRY